MPMAMRISVRKFAATEAGDTFDSKLWCFGSEQFSFFKKKGLQYRFPGKETHEKERLLAIFNLYCQLQSSEVVKLYPTSIV